MQKVELQPSAKVSVKRSVLKKYQVKDEDVYFLKKDAEFEIELFNPLSETIMCKLSFNKQNKTTEGLVLYPGQRIFLERHIDTDEKLIFNTYMIEDSAETIQATKNNGLIEVKFYKENFLDYTYYPANWNVVPNLIYTSPSITPSYDVTCTMSTTAFLSNTVETGRIGKGEKSKQALVNTNESFNSFSFYTIKFKILPDSVKLKTEEDFKHKKYCVECGAKVGTTDKFCAQCGAKI